MSKGLRFLFWWFSYVYRPKDYAAGCIYSFDGLVHSAKVGLDSRLHDCSNTVVDIVLLFTDMENLCLFVCLSVYLYACPRLAVRGLLCLKRMNEWMNEQMNVTVAMVQYAYDL